MLWKIYYGDGTTFSDADGSPWDAPRLDVQFIIYKLPHNGKFLGLSGADYYTFQNEFGWWYLTEMDMFDHLFKRGSNQLFLKGRMISYEETQRLSKQVWGEVKSIGGEKDSWRHMPIQQNVACVEEVG